MSFFVYLFYGGNVEILALVFLGLLQGLTEFLPVSSSGHLVLFGKLFGVSETLFVSIILHLATLFSVIIVFRKQIWQIIKNPFSPLSINLCLATIPTCIIALILMPFVGEAFEGKFLAFSFLISAILLFFAEKKNIPFKNKPLDHKGAIIMGIAQGLAIFPGISRSGTTISAGLFAGRDKKECANFSFLMSVPIILLSLFLEIFEFATTDIFLSVSWIGLSLSFLIAFLVGIFSIKLMIKLTQNSSLKYFSLYLVLIAIFTFFIL